MGHPSQRVLNWLHNVLTSEYRHVSRSFSDIAQTLSYNAWISLRTDVYTFEEGNSALLLNLYGSLPVSFRGTTYAFPISIWIPQEYPQSVPMSFVTPTKDLVVRPGQHVSGEGRIYHPFLAGWREESSNVSELIAVMQEVFAKEPPLVTRQVQIPRPPLAPAHDGGPPPVPPLPPELGISLDEGEQTSSRIGQPPPPPPLPPKPFGSQSQNIPPNGVVTPPLPLPPPRSSSQYGPPPHIRPGVNSRNTQPPVKSPYQTSDNTWDRPEAAQRHTNNHHTLSQQPHQESISPLSPQIPVAPQRPWFPDPTSPQQGHHTGGGTTYPLRPDSQQSHGTRQVVSPSQGHYHHPNPPVPFQQALQQQGPHVQKSKPPVDLLTSPFEATLPIQATHIAPPPIPPNPQKDALLSSLSQTLAEQVRSTYASNMSAIAPLQAQQAALITTLNKLNHEISHLNELEKLLSSNEAILHQAMRDADKVLDDAKRRQVPNVDEVLFAPTVVARQLYEAVADERAIEDCRSLLAKALDKGRIGGGVWAKQIRSLAREEFLKKALIKKISRGMGLIEEDRWN